MFQLTIFEFSELSRYARILGKFYSMTSFEGSWKLVESAGEIAKPKRPNTEKNF